MLTLQQIFDQTLQMLDQQGRVRSVNSRGKCLYRGNSGLKCAVGLWIPDDKYNQEWEGKSAYTLSTDYSGYVDGMAEVGIDVTDTAARNLLSSLQHFHDGYLKNHSWQEQIYNLDLIARQFTLSFNPDQWPEKK